MLDEQKEIKVIFQILEVLSKNNCSVEAIERILYNLKFAIKRYSTLQSPEMTPENVAKLFNCEIGYAKTSRNQTVYYDSL